MKSKVQKAVAGVSAGGLTVYLLHIFHIIHIFGNNVTPDIKFNKAKPVIILSDSTGKKDTMPLEEYMKLKEK
jgi:hypothetical protein